MIALLTRLWTLVSGQSTKIDAVAGKVDELSARIDSIEAGISAILERLDAPVPPEPPSGIVVEHVSQS